MIDKRILKTNMKIKTSHKINQKERGIEDIPSFGKEYLEVVDKKTKNYKHSNHKKSLKKNQILTSTRSLSKYPNLKLVNKNKSIQNNKNLKLRVSKKYLKKSNNLSRKTNKDD